MNSKSVFTLGVFFFTNLKTQQYRSAEAGLSLAEEFAEGTSKFGRNLRMAEGGLRSRRSPLKNIELPKLAEASLKVSQTRIILGMLGS